MEKDRKHCRHGFTLAELLVVVAIIGVLIALSIPIFSAQLEKARDAQSVDEIRQLYSRSMIDAVNYNGHAPDGTDGIVLDSEHSVFVGEDYYVYMHGSQVSMIIYRLIDFKSETGNNWSGMAEGMPCYDVMYDEYDYVTHTHGSNTNHGDIGGTVAEGDIMYILFDFEDGTAAGFLEPKGVFIYSAEKH